MEKIREQMIFYGRVQGVGFRYKANHIARHFGVTGWVRNEYDGSVSVEFQGTQAEVDMVVQRLVQDWHIEIDRIDRKKIPVEEQEKGFTIRG